MLTVIRNGISHRFDSGGVRVFQPGDQIVVITSKETPHKSMNRVRASPDARHPKVTPDRSRGSDPEWVD